MPNKIYCIEYFDGADWDTDHARLTDARASQFPLTNKEGSTVARIIKPWTEDEYKAAFGRDYQDFGESLGWASREEQEAAYNASLTEQDYRDDHPGPDCSCEHCQSVNDQIASGLGFAYKPMPQEARG